MTTSSPPVSPTMIRRGSLPIAGQGMIEIPLNTPQCVRFIVKTSKTGEATPSLQIDVRAGDISLFWYPAAFDEIQTKSSMQKISNFEAEGGIPYLSDNSTTTKYWLSIDSYNGVLRHGRGFKSASMSLKSIFLKANNENTNTLTWINPDLHEWLDKAKHVEIGMWPVAQSLPSPKMHKYPAVDIPALVKSRGETSMLELEQETCTVYRNLPAACQQLYCDIAGEKVTLDQEDFPDFATAIDRSCKTPGLWAYKKLHQKGDSPGIPYVLEIWPGGHYSPIHDHGNSCGVIKVNLQARHPLSRLSHQVLHGEIEATYYDSLIRPRMVGEAMRLQKGNVTWLGPENYQIHKLENKTDEVCCTIQSYKYEEHDVVHDEYFDYTNFDPALPNADTADDSIHKFTPNSDITYSNFRTIMKDEWEDHLTVSMDNYCRIQ